MTKLQIFSKYLPYEVTVKTLGYEPATSESPFEQYPVIDEVLTIENINYHLRDDISLLNLRPLESLTKEEWLELFSAAHPDLELAVIQKESWIEVLCKEYDIAWESFANVKMDNAEITTFKYYMNALGVFDSLYALHVDLDDAIEKGFAVDKTKFKS